MQVGFRSSLPNEWVSFHLFTCGDRDVILTNLVAPFLINLYKEGALELCHFVRYDEDGQHIRLRLLRNTNVGAAVFRSVALMRLQELVDTFNQRFGTEPQLEGWQTKNTSKMNDPRSVQRSQVLAIRIVETHLEVDRYGGRELFGLSAELFGVSSIGSLSQLTRPRFTRDWRSRGLIHAHLLIACCSSSSVEQVRFRLSYGLHWFDGSARARVREAQGHARTHKEFYKRLVLESLEATENVVSLSILQTASSLGREVATRGTDTADRVIMSQMHMHANRLGLSNGDEAVISGLLTDLLDGVEGGSLLESIFTGIQNGRHVNVGNSPLQEVLHELAETLASPRS